MLTSYFSVPLFFVVLRETLEIGIIVSVLIAFIGRLSVKDMTMVQNMKRMVWTGTMSAVLIVVAIGASIIHFWYSIGENIFEGSEMIYEAVFGIIASLFLTITAFAFLKGTNLYDSITRKLEKKFVIINTDTAAVRSSSGNTATTTTNIEPSLQTVSSSSIIAVRLEESVHLPDASSTSTNSWRSFCNSFKHIQIFFWVPFLTVIREGVETVLLIGGVSFSESPSSIPISAFFAIFCGALISILLHRASGKLSMKWFFIVAAYILLIMASGIFSRSVGYFEDDHWMKTIGVDEDIEVPPFDPTHNVWYLPCCWEKKQPMFGLLFSLFGYRAVATIGTVSSYICYWIMVITVLVFGKYFGNYGGIGCDSGSNRVNGDGSEEGERV